MMVLGYSRAMYAEVLERCTMKHFLECHQRAFGYFGGVPAEILYDNMKNVVIRRFTGGVKWNQRFFDFSLHYQFSPVVCPPYAPWVKGKVERPIHYVRERFWRDGAAAIGQDRFHPTGVSHMAMERKQNRQADASDRRRH